MPLVFLIGGARSGKSGLAVRLAAAEHEVVFIATGEARDDEMAERIDEHRRERPASWRTVEEPLLLHDAITAAAPVSCVVVDCLTLWTSNALEQLGAERTEAEAEAAATAAAARPGLTIAVSNEVGLGIVPDNALARAYRDILGRVNTEWALAADRAFFVVAGRAIPLGEPTL